MRHGRGEQSGTAQPGLRAQQGWPQAGYLTGQTLVVDGGLLAS
jgi:hypothetical protein